MANELEFKADAFSVVAIVATIISIIISFNLPVIYLIISIASILFAFFTYVVLSFGIVQNRQGLEIKKLNEKLNIHKELIDLKAKVNYLIDKMGKKGQNDFAILLIRLIQIVLIGVAVFIILKGLRVV